MRILILEKSTGKIHYSSIINNEIDDLAKLFYRKITDSIDTDSIIISGINYFYNFKIYDHMILILYQKVNLFSKLKNSEASENNIDEIFSLVRSARSYAIDLLKPHYSSGKEFEKRLFGLINIQIKKILNYHFFESTNKVGLTGINSTLLHDFFENIYGIESILELQPFKIKIRKKSILIEGSSYFSSNAKFLTILYYFDNGELDRYIKKGFVKNFEKVIYLDEKNIFLNSEENWMINIVKKSKIMKKSLVLLVKNHVNNKDLSQSKKKNILFPIEDILLQKERPYFLEDIVKKHFIENSDIKI